MASKRPVSRLSVTALVAACSVSVALLLACSNDDQVGTDLPESSVAAVIDRMYKFDAAGTLPLADRSELPVPPGTVTARWYTFRGWYVAVFDGLDIEATGPLCLGTSFFNPSSNQLEHVFASPTAEGACDSAGDGAAPLARDAAGARVCSDLVSYVTDIPAFLDGAIFATLTAYSGEGAGVAISSRAETSMGPPTEIDASKLDCGPLPEAVALPPPTPVPTMALTPAPASAGDIAAADRAPPPAPTKTDTCASAEPRELQDITDTTAAPYFVHHPTPGNPAAQTVVFLPGGSGRRGSAEQLWEKLFDGEAGAEGFRVVIPYSLDAEFIDEATRTFAIINEVLWCYGGDPSKVHLAGTSNGGLAAFALMMASPEHFATLLGAPGAFPVQDPADLDPAVLAEALAGRAVFNGVGAHDNDWRPEVIATHNALAAAGVESVFVEFAGQGHILPASFDAAVFFDFWSNR